MSHKYDGALLSYGAGVNSTAMAIMLVNEGWAMCSGIYQIKNRVTDKCYVGSAVNVKRRWRDHLKCLRYGRHRNPHLQAAFNKYGEETFIFSVLEKATAEVLIGREQHYLDMLKPEYNISRRAGSQLGYRHSLETRRKIGKALKGRHHSREHRRKISEAMRGNRNPMYRKVFSEETRRKMSEAHTGKPHPHKSHHPSAETRARMSQARKAYWRGLRATRNAS